MIEIRHRPSPLGQEAEELRSGIERLISSPEYVHDEIAMVHVSDLRKLLDDVDARDSLAHIASPVAEDISATEGDPR